ncbi:acid protease [Mycena olivaceomarginata]|nr:acid protease [Mycena olivaceomarginata]
MGAEYVYEYLVNITIGSQAFSVIVDTGSSDTWLARKGFSCLNLTGHPVPVSTCAFGTQGFDSQLSESFQAYPKTIFDISYGDGEFLRGTAAFETVSIGGLTVKHQVIGVVSSAAWVGDGINSGLLGLAYPELTSVTNAGEIKQKKISHPYFSIALDRGTAAETHSPAADPHLRGYSLATRTPTTDRHPTYFYYTVDVQKYAFPNSSGVATANNNTIIDSGTTLNLVPSEVARAYNKGFGTWRDGSYYVDCAATAPPFNVTIGQKTFSIDPRDQVVWAGKDENGKSLCISGTQDGGPETTGSIFILGDVFLHSVVVTFDIEKNQMTFTQRQRY